MWRGYRNALSSVEEFRTRLLDWYSIRKRRFPWRDTADPYAVLIAELLLQKTNAEKVEPIYLEFMQRFPLVHKLQGASIEEIAEVTAPLGLFYRAIRIWQIADTLVKQFNGTVPNNPEELATLPGVGPYITNATLCFAFGQPQPLIDTNSARVLKRVFGLASTKKRPRADRQMWEFASRMVPETHPKEYNWALIDLAHLFCRPRKPLHEECPLKDMCLMTDIRIEYRSKSDHSRL